MIDLTNDDFRKLRGQLDGQIEAVRIQLEEPALTHDATQLLRGKLQGLKMARQMVTPIPVAEAVAPTIIKPSANPAGY